MTSPKLKSSPDKIENVLNFVGSSKGLRAENSQSNQVRIVQQIDNKAFAFDPYDVLDVLNRTDSDNKPFLQLNFKNSQKVLFTDSLVGFKPVPVLGLDMSRLPRVVTTPDLQSVFDAIEESLGSDHVDDHEVEVLKKVYQSILHGGEKIGFELPFEKKWWQRLVSSRLKACA
ncbi:MAG: hypothetical protein ACOYOK_15055 [Pseudobdellovibrionaceae bacterium]